MKLGRLPREHNFNIPSYGQMKAMLRSSMTPIPPLQIKLDHAAVLEPFIGMMLNDTEGCCTCAAMGHETQLVTKRARGSEVTPHDDAVQEAYIANSGYQPGNPSTDTGCTEQTVLTWWKQTGLLLPDGMRHQIDGFVEVDKTNLTYVCEAIQEFGCVYIGFLVPEELMMEGPPPVWDLRPGYSPRPNEGHCVILTGFDRTNPGKITFNAISWGTRQWVMTQAFFQTYVDEVYAVIDPLWIDNTGKTPLGLSEEQLNALAAAI